MEEKHLVLVGAGHAHLETLLAIPRFREAGIRVSVVAPDSYQYYSGMGPGLLSGWYAPHNVRFNIRSMASDRGADFIEDKIVRFLPERRIVATSRGIEIPYDAVSFNIGSVVAAGNLDPRFENVIPVKPVRNLYRARCRLEHDLAREGSVGPLVVVGGGPAGIEIAANLARLTGGDSRAPVRLISGGPLLRQFPDGLRRRALSKLEELGVEVLQDTMVQGNTADEILLESGATIPFGFLFLASGTRPPELFRDSSLPVGENGGLAVDENLKSPAYSEVFGGGDCIDFGPAPLARVGVYAVRQNPILRDNLLATLEGAPLRRFIPQKRYLLILNMGDKTGILHRSGFSFRGRLAFRLKDRIDRSFMERYQVSGEADEGEDCID